MPLSNGAIETMEKLFQKLFHRLIYQQPLFDDKNVLICFAFVNHYAKGVFQIRLCIVDKSWMAVWQRMLDLCRF